MIPLIDDFLMCFIACKLKFLKEHPNLIDLIFRTSKRETLDNLKDFILNQKIKVIIGYPKDQNRLPCYVITMAPENEVPMGLGDEDGIFFENFDELGQEFTDEESEVEMLEAALETMAVSLNGTYMNTNYRIECWSDNGDLTSYMYVILKWALWTSRMEMFKLNWVNITFSGTDLEPVPDYMPVFIYRRSLMVTAQVENLYFSGIVDITVCMDIIQNPGDYYEDEDGNIRRKSDDEIVLIAKYVVIIRDHWYQAQIEAGLKERP